ncbi:MAG TPA: thiamine pyrophosphate-dependent dehydrogenase E1 component subunit alpha [Geminicoccaceae bacterium]|nr:thiamine pyrophosphate-dependent dehydrogenase E1 component subunit alpha [Geminicoccus sp.]HMU51594.1 thiamine pyrophosphate-dependent dehydrogenase E1 component subunit alpha [Geminicoccaceae bacterium]
MQLSREDLLEAYRRMRMIREFEDAVHDEFSAGAIPGFVHLYAGEEASGVGVCMHLDDRDAIASTHRGHGHCIAKGCDEHGMMLEIFGRKDGLCGGKGGSMHIADLSKGMMGANGIVGGGPPLICGAALTAKTLKTGGVAIAFVGDGASNQGTTFESYNLAKVWNLPAIFIVEDNGYAESTGSRWSVAGSQVGRGQGFGMPATEVDGSDFFAVWEAAREAIERARNGGGPSLLHHRVMRYYGHFEGDATTYKDPNEVANYKASKDPLMLFRRRVAEAGLLDGAAMDEIDRAARSRIAQCVAEAKAAPQPGEADLLTDVYVSY